MVGGATACSAARAVGDTHETVVVRAESPLVDRASSTVGHVVTRQEIQEIPLNGRHFIDLSLLVPGSVAPSQTGFSTRPIRGVGALAVNISGNREEAVGFLVNGVSTNNLTFGSLIFEPPVGSIQEFKVDNSGLSPEHGHVSGAIANIVTRSGTDAFHGDVFEFARNERIRVEWPVLAALDRREVRLLDRTGKPLPVELPLSEDQAHGVVVDMSLSGLPRGDYLIELTAGGGGATEKSLLAVRIK